MFCVVYGAYGVGKTSVMDELIERYGYEMIRPVTTRASRGPSDKKVSIDRKEFLRLRAAGAFCLVGKHFGEFYAAPLAPIERASGSPDGVAFLDFQLKERNKIKSYEDLGIILMPESEAQLTKQLIHGGRADRVEATVRELRTSYQAFIERGLPANMHVVINRAGGVDQAAREVQALISAAQFEANRRTIRAIRSPVVDSLPPASQCPARQRVSSHKPGL